VAGRPSSRLDRPVSEIMTSPVVTVLFSDPVIAAVSKMVAHDIGAVVVMSAGEPAGIITERDVLERVVLEDRNPRTTTCQEVMSKPLITVTPDTPMTKALEIMRKHGIRRLPVVRGRALVGIVTEKDIIRKLL